MIPLDEKENNDALELANNYYKTCKADENSGKTVWLGIEAELMSEEWKVCLLINNKDVNDMCRQRMAK